MTLIALVHCLLLFFFSLFYFGWRNGSDLGHLVIFAVWVRGGCLCDCMLGHEARESKISRQIHSSSQPSY